ncbi:MAG: choice-of-anchor Q domain-containing protein [Planctomycetaceae bacterium]
MSKRNFRRWATKAVNRLTTRKRQSARQTCPTEALEERVLLTDYTPTFPAELPSNHQLYPQTLRFAVEQANANAGKDRIILSTGLLYIISSPLPITDDVDILQNGDGVFPASTTGISAGNRNHRVLNIDDGTTGKINVEIRGITITGGGDGTTPVRGAGLLNAENLTLRNVSMTDNDAATGFGGAINHLDGDLHIVNSTFSNNSGACGGAFWIQGANTDAKIINSTFSENSASDDGGALVVLASTTIRNSTFTENRADDDGVDGGVGGAIFTNSDVTTLHNTLVAGNFRGTGTNTNDLAGSFRSESSYNLIGDAGTPGGLTHDPRDGSGDGKFNIVGNAGSGTLTTSSVLDTALQNNGGLTPTHALAANSLAIDAGSNAEADDENGNQLQTDQRFFPDVVYPRIVNGNLDDTATVDIGAFEQQYLTVPVGRFVVDTDTDVVDGDYSEGNLSLREAINSANRTDDPDTITFNPLMAYSTITLTEGDLNITEDLTLRGLGAHQLTISGNNSSRIFDISGDETDVTLEHIHLTNGMDDTGDGGGAIRTRGKTLTVRNSYFSDNDTTGQGGAIDSDNNDDRIVISRSTFAENTASGTDLPDGGAIQTGGELDIDDSTFSGNRANGRGGAFRFGSASVVTIDNATITGNHADNNNSGSEPGGGISSNSDALTIKNTILVGNFIGPGTDYWDNSNATLSGGSTNNLIGGGLSTAQKILDTNLTWNGGFTPTHALIEGSAAIDAGADASSTDQRGRSRAGEADIGAYESTLVAVGDSATTTAGTTVNIGVTENDGGSPQVVSATSTSGNGTLEVKDDGTIDYVPNEGFTGSDQFEYSVSRRQDVWSSFNATAEEGNAVAIDGDFAVVGARRADFYDTNAGGAMVYRRSTFGWVRVQYLDDLVARELEIRDRFGYSVAISGTTIAVGARLDDDAGFKSGSVYIFEFDAISNSFVFTQKLTDVGGTERGQFGHAVALEGDTLVVGARRERNGVANSGAVVVLERTPQGFQPTKRIKVTDGAKGDQFGFAVSISGDTIAASAWKDNTGSLVDSGSVYLFDRNQDGANQWGQVAKVLPSDNQQFDQFGFSLDLDGDTLVVGKAVRSREDRAGGAYVYERNQNGSNSWGEVKAFQSVNSKKLDNFGWSVRLKGDDAIIGARLDKTGGNGAGAAYVHSRNQGGADNWGMSQSFFGQRKDSFGFAVDLDESTILIGANLRDGTAVDNGSVIFEDRHRATATVTVQVNANQLSGSGVGFGGSEITGEELAPIVDAARDYWRRQQGLTSGQLAALDSAQVNVASLSGALLGFESGGKVTIDSDAAGHGWYVDQTPQNLHDDHIGNRMDLLSNVTHELGHVIGLADRYDAGSADDVMHGFLSLGERQLSSGSETGSLDQLFASVSDKFDSIFE